MQVFQSVDDFHLAQQENVALTIGNFDGLHQGHSHLLKILRNEANKLGIPTAILTFQQHTSITINPDRPKTTLTDASQKSKLIQDSKLVDYLILQDFNNDFKSIDANNFIDDILVRRLKVKLIVIGQDHRFGKDRLGDLNLLKKQAIVKDFIVLGIDLLKIDGKVISSTAIRAMLGSS
jgi:riboflavin kinase/FMN adenylyltransferase